MTSTHLPATLLLLGSGELGKEVAIAAQRLGCRVVAVDRYDNAPAMQVADTAVVIAMTDAEALKQVIRDLAAGELGLRTARFGYASSAEEMSSAAAPLGWPVVVKPVMSSSGKGQSVATNPEELQQAWTAATQGARGSSSLVIVEEFLRFEQEITLLTVRQKEGPTLFCPPIGHIQERGDYQCSWQPAELQQSQLLEAQRMARQVTDALGGAGIFGVEFFIASGEVIFSELSPRPHDTGLVTLRGQNLSEFELHLRAVLGLPIPSISSQRAAASRVILAAPDQQGGPVFYKGVQDALQVPESELLLFGKPEARPMRRMGVALASGSSLAEARGRADTAAKAVALEIGG
jgi:phosphoribosylglycinamide formyltransferase 2